MAERSRWSPAVLAEWALVAAVVRAFAWLPARAAYALGEGAGRLAFRLDRRHRRIAEENLARAFPEQHSTDEVGRLALAVFENLGRTVVDLARSDRLVRGRIRDFTRIEGVDRILEARRRGKGVLFISAHLGPWELLPLVHTEHIGRPLHVVARPLDNPRLDDLLTAMRERGGNQVIRKRDAVQAILQVLRGGEAVAILIDQHISEREGVVVPFFGQPASTASAPALIAMRSGAAVFPVGILREARGKYRVRIAEEVPVRRSGDLKADLVENTARFTAAIEALIRERPDHWFWVHRRWKTTLPIDPSLESRKGVRDQVAAPSHGRRP